MFYLSCKNIIWWKKIERGTNNLLLDLGVGTLKNGNLSPCERSKWAKRTCKASKEVKILPHSFSPSHMQKKKKIKNSHMDGGQLKNVCLSVVCLSVVCLSVVCCLCRVRPQLSLAQSDIGLNFFLQKLEKICIWEF